MKQTLLFFVTIVLFGTSDVSSQTIVNEAQPVKSICAVSYNPVHPLVLVDGFETDMESMSIDPNNIESITILKNQTGVDKYGEKGKEGVILITTKPGTQFYKIADFVDPSKDLNTGVSKIQLNGKPLLDKNKLLIDRTAVTNSLISSECKPSADLKSGPENTLLINTSFGGKK